MRDVRALAAGVILTGFDGDRIDDALRARLRSRAFGGFVLFARNVRTLEQLRRLTGELASFGDPPPLVAIDQEGGRVARIRDGVEELPPMMALGATGDASLARRAGEQLAFDLRRAGCTHDFAPVADLALHAGNTVIGSRAFGSSPTLVTELAGAFLDGLRDGGIGGTLKHFPGHGDTTVDSHLALPVVDAPAATLRARDLLPFQALLSRAPSIMASHVVAHAFDDAVPASLSSRLLTGLLRDEWNYDGVCFTDCMQMDAIARGIGTVSGVVAAIGAGADCAIVSHDVELAIAAADRLAETIEAGLIPRTRVEEAHARVLRLRAAAASPLPIDAIAPHPGIGREIARRAVTLVRGVAHADPTASIVVSFEGATVEGAQGALDLRASLRTEAPSVEECVLSLDPPEREVAGAIDAIERSRRRPILVLRRAFAHDTQRDAARRIVARFPDALVILAREPYDGAMLPHARHVVAIYGDSPVSLAGAADVIFGSGAALGTIPVDLTSV